MSTALSCDRRGRFRSLAAFGRRLQGAVRLIPLLESLTDQVRRLLCCERCSIFLLDEAKQELWTRVAHGVQGRELRIPKETGIAGRVLRAGRALNVRDPYSCPDFNPEVDRQTGYTTRNILAVPLKDREGRTFGVFEALNKRRGAFNREDEGLLELLAALAGAWIEGARLFEELRGSYIETIQRLALMAEYRDQEDTARHLRRVSAYAGLIAEALGMDGERAEAVEIASPLHDVGKVAVADIVLKKPGPLNQLERARMRRHCTYGWRILSKANSPLLRLAAEIALDHHERFDGSGYPRGLKGREIPIEAEVVAAADVLDALTSPRAYKRAWPFDEAARHILRQSGRQFSPQVVRAFRKAMPGLRESFERQWRRSQ